MTMTTSKDGKLGANHDGSYVDHLDKVVFAGRRKLAAHRLRHTEGRATSLQVITLVAAELGWPTNDLSSWYGYTEARFAVITAMSLANAARWKVAEEMEKS